MVRPDQGQRAGTLLVYICRASGSSSVPQLRRVLMVMGEYEKLRGVCAFCKPTLTKRSTLSTSSPRCYVVRWSLTLTAVILSQGNCPGLHNHGTKFRISPSYYLPVVHARRSDCSRCVPSCDSIPPKYRPLYAHLVKMREDGHTHLATTTLCRDPKSVICPMQLPPSARTSRDIPGHNLRQSGRASTALVSGRMGHL